MPPPELMGYSTIKKRLDDIADKKLNALEACVRAQEECVAVCQRHSLLLETTQRCIAECDDRLKKCKERAKSVADKASAPLEKQLSKVRFGFLIITAAELQEIAQYLAQTWFKDPVVDTTIKTVRSGAELVNELSRDVGVGSLMILAHGGAGSLEFRSGRKTEVFELGVLALRLKRQTPMFVSDEVYFEGCNVGRDTKEIVKIAKILRPGIVWAWNHFHVFQRLDIPKGIKKGKLQQDLDYFDGYLVKDSPDINALVTTAGRKKQRVYAEWFTEHNPKDDPELEQLPRKGSARRRHKRRDSAVTKEISPETAPVYDAEQSGIPTGRDLHHIRITR